MRALSIQQPWAWAVLHAGKTPENRAWTRRPGVLPGERLLVHAGKRLDLDAVFDRQFAAAWLNPFGDHPDDPAGLPRGALLGTVRVADVHHANECASSCSPWALPGCWHIGVSDPYPFDEPISARGQLGFWTPTELADSVGGGRVR